MYYGFLFYHYNRLKCSTCSLPKKWENKQQFLILFGSQVIEADLQSSALWDLTEEGKQVAKDGSHEAQVFNAIPPAGSTQAEIVVF